MALAWDRTGIAALGAAMLLGCANAPKALETACEADHEIVDPNSHLLDAVSALMKTRRLTEPLAVAQSLRLCLRPGSPGAALHAEFEQRFALLSAKAPVTTDNFEYSIWSNKLTSGVVADLKISLKRDGKDCLTEQQLRRYFAFPAGRTGIPVLTCYEAGGDRRCHTIRNPATNGILFESGAPGPLHLPNRTGIQYPPIVNGCAVSLSIYQR